jgi:hypothetical protein
VFITSPDSGDRQPWILDSGKPPPVTATGKSQQKKNPNQLTQNLFLISILVFKPYILAFMKFNYYFFILHPDSRRLEVGQIHGGGWPAMLEEV